MGAVVLHGKVDLEFITGRHVYMHLSPRMISRKVAELTNRAIRLGSESSPASPNLKED